jgi:hypothetical protein
MGQIFTSGFKELMNFLACEDWSFVHDVRYRLWSTTEGSQYRNKKK